MLSKYLEKRIEVMPDENSFSLSNPIELHYYLLESDNSETEEFQSETVYGIEIVKIVNAKKIESGIVRNLSSCKKSTEFILNKLAKNTVTPVGMPFVLDDMIGV